ncbi:hypothetical protein Tcan_14001 [Toxocara canis]|uniref:Uncharacterized protein n=1 Tax=Toxocara canis TaxID=6265 RepID=A0A0B2VXH2_TOXCA|nr:hypothetical protein Tcan_14001 [Toxocara canis]
MQKSAGISDDRGLWFRRVRLRVGRKCANRGTQDAVRYSGHIHSSYVAIALALFATFGSVTLEHSPYHEAHDLNVSSYWNKYDD